MRCAYCRGQHETARCPTLSLERLEEGAGAAVRNAAKQLDERLGDIGTELSDVSGALGDLGWEVAALHGTLRDGLAMVSSELKAVRGVLERTLPHPVQTTGRDMYEIGLKLLRRGFRTEAENKLVEAMAIDPSSYATRIALGFCYLETGREIDAVKTFEAAERLADRADETAYACLLAGRALMSLDATDAARTVLERACAARPESPWCWYALAQCEGAAGRADPCWKALRRAIDLDAGNLPRALIDPFMTDVRTDMTRRAQLVEAAAHDAARAMLVAAHEGVERLQPLRPYVPLEFQTLGKRLDERDAQLQPGRYLRLVSARDGAAAVVRDSEALFKEAKSRERAYRQELDEKYQLKGDESVPWISEAIGIPSWLFGPLVWIGLVAAPVVGCQVGAAAAGREGPGWMVGVGVGFALFVGGYALFLYWLRRSTIDRLLRDEDAIRRHFHHKELLDRLAAEFREGRRHSNG